MANINSQNISKAEETLQLASKDLISFGKLFLPDDFMRSETPFLCLGICYAKIKCREYGLYQTSFRIQRYD